MIFRRYDDLEKKYTIQELLDSIVAGSVLVMDDKYRTWKIQRFEPGDGEINGVGWGMDVGYSSSYPVNIVNKEK